MSRSMQFHTKLTLEDTLNLRAGKNSVRATQSTLLIELAPDCNTSSMEGRPRTYSDGRMKRVIREV